MGERGPSRAPGFEPGDLVTLEIEGLSHEGDGVGRAGGRAIFVTGGLPGEEVRARLTAIRRTYARATVADVLRPSPDRLQPPCPVYWQCGGCQFQHLAYPAELEAKTRRAADALERIGGFRSVTVHPCHGMDDPWHYRNKAQFPVGVAEVAAGRGGRERGGARLRPARELVAGLYARGTHRIVPVGDCRIQHPANNRILEAVVRLAREYRLEPYDEDSGRGLLRHILARVGVGSGEAMAVLLTTTAEVPKGKELARALMARVPEVVSVQQNTNPRRTNVILGPKTRVLAGKDHVTDRIGPFSFRVGAESFFQVNPAQTETLYAKAVEYAGLTGTETALDLYSGTGAISLFLARGTAEVIGVEIVPRAVRDAVQNARLNGVRNVRFIEGAAERVLPALAREGLRPEVVVLDPPRKGAEPAVIDAIRRIRPRRVVYVSCEPATMARDAARLAASGDGARFRLTEVQPVDMFPQTAHVELVARLERADR